MHLNSPSQEFRIEKNELMQLCKKYCDILRYEFLFNKPCQKIDNLLEDSYERLKEQGLISIPSVSFPISFANFDFFSERIMIVTDENDFCRKF